MTITIDALGVWVAAVDEGYLDSRAWVAWAERELEAASPVPPWLLDIWYASDSRDALTALWAGLHALDSPHTGARFPEITSLRLGMMWLRHERGDLPLARLLVRAGTLTDTHDFSSPACEEVYAILNDIEAGLPSSEGSRSEAEAVRMFARHAARARAGLFEILGVPVDGRNGWRSRRRVGP